MYRKNELKLQTELVASAKSLQGWGRKLSSKMQVGVLDLTIDLPGHPVSWYVEVKDLGTVSPGFDQKLEITPKQRLEMRTVMEAYDKAQGRFPKACAVVVGFWLNKERGIAVLPWFAERLSEYDLDKDNIYSDWREKGRWYGLGNCLAKVKETYYAGH